MEILVHAPALRIAPATGSAVLAVIVMAIVAPVCAPPFIAVKAAARVAYEPLPATAPDTVTCAEVTDAKDNTVTKNK